MSNYVRHQNSENVLQLPHNVNFLGEILGVVFSKGSGDAPETLGTLKKGRQLQVGTSALCKSGRVKNLLK